MLKYTFPVSVVPEVELISELLVRFQNLGSENREIVNYTAISLQLIICETPQPAHSNRYVEIHLPCECGACGILILKDIDRFPRFFNFLACEKNKL